ncbi:hypothetical protein M2428_001360 [Arthrobacter sp. ES3-54]|nr:hypothetical protein [Arthrobacter sp. ES3-54]
MEISVNSSSAGASRIRALDRVRLMDVLERLPTKYPILKALACSFPMLRRRLVDGDTEGDRAGGPDSSREHSPASAE